MRLHNTTMIALVVVAALHSTTACAQQPIEFVTVQDSLNFPLRQNGQYIPASSFSGAYVYEMGYDPFCRTRFTFTECKKNGQLLKLLAWNDGAAINAPAELMTFNSRTENTLLHAGDTISFYHDFAWYNPVDNKMLTTNYYALDTLEMIVHLVRATDGSPLVQLDSIGAIARPTPGMPTIYGTQPIMAIISYVVPQQFQGDSAFVGVTLRAKGSGPHYFTRYDEVTVGMSNRLQDIYYQAYLANFGAIYAKRSLNDLMKDAGQEGAMLAVSSDPRSPRDIRIIFNGPRDGGSATISIYDESGNLVFFPYNSRTDATQAETSYRVPSRGAYFVALGHNGKIVKTTRTIITQ